MNDTVPSKVLLSTGLQARIDGQELASRLRKETTGEVLFDRGSRGRYSTDASIYQIEPVGVFIPRTEGDVVQALAIARDAHVPVLARGAAPASAARPWARRWSSTTANT